MRLENEYGLAELPLRELRHLSESAYSASKLEKKAAHRPLNSVKHRGLTFLIHALYKRIVEEAQGELTLWEDSAGDLKGTLPALLDMLRPYLPGVLPKKLTFSTLYRVLAKAKKSRLSVQ